MNGQEVSIKHLAHFIFGMQDLIQAFADLHKPIP
jgi:hypothetical protein